MAEIDKEFELRYVRAKALADSKDISLSLTACNQLIEATKVDSHLLDKSFTIYRYVYRRSNPSAKQYDWFEKGVLKDFPHLELIHPKSNQTKPTSGPDEYVSQWDIEYVSQRDNPDFELSGIGARLRALSTTVKETEENEIKKFCYDRNIQRLFHFSHVSNLKSILYHGILGRKTLDAKGLPFHSTDEKRLDLLPNAISLSISQPNLLMLSNKTHFLQTNNWIVLEIAPSILLSHEFAAFPSNAAASDLTQALRSEPEKFCGTYGLRQMFTDGKVSPRAKVAVGSNVSRSKLALPEDITTDPQAELMILSPIDGSNIRRVMASTSASKNYSGILDEVEIEFPSKVVQRNFKPLDAPFDLTGLKGRTLSWESIDEAMRLSGG